MYLRKTEVHITKQWACSALWPKQKLQREERKKKISNFIFFLTCSPSSATLLHHRRRRSCPDQLSCNIKNAHLCLLFLNLSSIWFNTPLIFRIEARKSWTLTMKTKIKWQRWRIKTPNIGDLIIQCKSYIVVSSFKQTEVKENSPTCKT